MTCHSTPSAWESRSGACAVGSAHPVGGPELGCDYTVRRDRKSAPAEPPVTTVIGG